MLRLITTDTKEELDLLKSRIETPEAYAHRITDPEQTLRKIEELKDFYVQERKSTRKGT